jgi:peptidoglycan/LPS O-acetylase OafA/YrhL
MPELELRLPPGPSSRLAVLDELKGLAIIIIVLYHAGGVLVWNNYFHGDVGVDMFFILSGLGLSLSRRVDSFGSFLRRRALRLLPAYWLVLIGYIFCNEHFLQLHYSPFNIGVHLVGLHSLFGDAIGLAINDSFWFITAILFLYPCFYWLRPTLQKLDRFILISALLSAAVALAFFFTGQGGMMGHMGFRLPGFFLGMVIGRGLRVGSIQLPLTATLGLGLLIYGYLPYTRGITYYSVLVGLAVMGAYVWTIRPHLSETGRAATTVNWLGRHSLEIFLIHQPLIREYNLYLHGRWLNINQPSELSLIVGMAIGLACTLMIAAELRRLQDRFIHL